MQVSRRQKVPCAISILKEDTHAFGIFSTKVVSFEEAFNFLITLIHFSISRRYIMAIR